MAHPTPVVLVAITAEERAEHTRRFWSANTPNESSKFGVHFYLQHPEKLRQIELDAIRLTPSTETSFPEPAFLANQPILCHLLGCLDREPGKWTGQNYERIIQSMLDSVMEFGFKIGPASTAIEGLHPNERTVGRPQEASRVGRPNVIHFLITSFINHNPSLLLRFIRVLVKQPSFQPHLLSYIKPKSSRPETISIYQHLISNWDRPFPPPELERKPREEFDHRAFTQLEILGELMRVDTITSGPRSERHSKLDNFFDYVLSGWLHQDTIPAELIIRFFVTLPRAFLMKVNLTLPRPSKIMWEIEQRPSWLQQIQQVQQQWKYNSPAKLVEQVFATIVHWQQQQQQPQPHSSTSTTTSISTILPQSIPSSSAASTSSIGIIDIDQYFTDLKVHLDSTRLASNDLARLIVNNKVALLLPTETIHTILTSAQPLTASTLSLLESYPGIYCGPTLLQRTLFGRLMCQHHQLIKEDQDLLLRLIQLTVEAEGLFAAEQFLRELMQSQAVGDFPTAIYALLLPHQSPLPELYPSVQRKVRVIGMKDSAQSDMTPIYKVDEELRVDRSHPVIVFIDRMVRYEFKISIDATTDWSHVDLLFQCLPSQKELIRSYITHRCLMQLNTKGLKLWLTSSPFMLEAQTSPIFWATDLVDTFLALVQGGILKQQVGLVDLWKEIRLIYEKSWSSFSQAVYPIVMSECQFPTDVISYVLLSYFQHRNLIDQYPFALTDDLPPLREERSSL